MGENFAGPGGIKMAESTQPVCHRKGGCGSPAELIGLSWLKKIGGFGDLGQPALAPQVWRQPYF